MQLLGYWKWVKRLLLLGAGALLVTLVAGWMMFQHVPRWYQPSPVPPERIQAVRDDLTRTFAGFSDLLISSKQPFEYQLSQDQINAWLSAPEEVWPGSRNWLPPELSDPQVAIDEDGLRLGVKYQHKGVASILNLRLTAQVLPDRLTVALAETATGALPLPHDWVLKQLVRRERDWWPVGEPIPDQIGDMPYPSLANLAEGVDFPILWIWRNGERPFRIDGLRYRPGVLHLTIEPLPR